MATRINLSIEDKNKLVQYLLGECGEGKPAYGLFAAAAELFGVHQHTVYNLWTRAKRQIDEGECIFDGKIGFFPFTEQIPAARNNKNRQKGTLETKNIHSITKKVFKECIISQVIPAIKAKWHRDGLKDIMTQQDNAKPHIQNNDTEFREMASSDGFNIQLVHQLANSPDTNINGLGWFRSIQSLQYKKKAYTVDDLVKNVGEAYDELSAVNLNKVFLSLQQCCIEIIGAKGHNNYTLPHMGKDALILQGAMPDNLEIDQVKVRESIQYLMEHEREFQSSFDVLKLKEDLGI